MASAAPSASRRGRAMIAGINITPMVDIVLVLLVIMMVSAKFIVSKTIKVDLPKAATADAGASSPAAVTILASGQMLFNSRPVTIAALTAQLQTAVAADKGVSLVVSADKLAKHGDVMLVIDIARAVGIEKFAVNVSEAQ